MITSPFVDTHTTPFLGPILNATRAVRVQTAQDAVRGKVAPHGMDDFASPCYTGCSHWYDALMHAFTPTRAKSL